MAETIIPLTWMIVVDDDEARLQAQIDGGPCVTILTATGLQHDVPTDHAYMLLDRLARCLDPVVEEN